MHCFDIFWNMNSCQCHFSHSQLNAISPGFNVLAIEKCALFQQNEKRHYEATKTTNQNIILPLTRIINLNSCHLNSCRYRPKTWIASLSVYVLASIWSMVCFFLSLFFFSYTLTISIFSGHLFFSLAFEIYRHSFCYVRPRRSNESSQQLVGDVPCLFVCSLADVSIWLCICMMILFVWPFFLAALLRCQNIFDERNVNWETGIYRSSQKQKNKNTIAKNNNILPLTMKHPIQLSIFYTYHRISFFRGAFWTGNVIACAWAYVIFISVMWR